MTATATATGPYPFNLMLQGDATTLTLYILQSVVFVPVFYHFGADMWNDWSQATRFGVGIGAVAIQMGLAAWWLQHFQYGPIEWVWRALTYQTRDIPFRKKAAA